MIHVDTFIDDCMPTNRAESYAKFVLMLMRMPAWMQANFSEWTKQFKLYCKYKDKFYRVTGASRLGDIWLANDLDRETGYDLRVDVGMCSNWCNTPSGNFKDSNGNIIK